MASYFLYTGERDKGPFYPRVPLVVAYSAQDTVVAILVLQKFSHCGQLRTENKWDFQLNMYVVAALNS